MIIFSAGIPEIDHHRKWLDLKRDLQDAKNAAGIIDEYLRDHAIERYFFIGRNGIEPFAYTRHSPLGRIFTKQPGRFGNPKKRELFFEHLMKASAPIIISDNSDKRSKDLFRQVTAVFRERNFYLRSLGENNRWDMYVVNEEGRHGFYATDKTP